jgi:hypothetical protein
MVGKRKRQTDKKLEVGNKQHNPVFKNHPASERTTATQLSRKAKYANGSQQLQQIYGKWITNTTE